MEEEYKKSVVRDYFESIVIAVILALFVITFVFQSFKIPTGSMEDTLLIGDHIIANKMIFAPTRFSFERKILPVRDIKRGDVIVFRYPVDPNWNFVKRVIGLPGDKIEIKDRVVYVNDKPLSEPYVVHKFPYLTTMGDNYGPVVVPKGCYFVLGDNRDNSRDSRYWGFVPRSLIRGRAFIIYWSYEAERGTYLETGFKNRVRNFFSILFHFFTKTRWRRSFTLVR
ncbi:MAG: signal peptidase I [Acidobacteria bacterium]|nr:signal peptidase I [Acidobacteriota bacterium]